MLAVHRHVGMSAKYAVGVTQTTVRQRPERHLGREPQPACVEAVHETREALALEVHLLHLKVHRRQQIRDEIVVQHEAIKLVSMDCQMLPPGKDPFILLVDANSDQVRHDFSESLVVVALDPNYLDGSFGIRQLADASQEFPMFFVQAPEVQVRENVAQQNEPPEAILFQHVAGIPSEAQLGPEMQIREDESVVARKTHHPWL